MKTCFPVLLMLLFCSCGGENQPDEVGQVNVEEIDSTEAVSPEEVEIDWVENPTPANLEIFRGKLGDLDIEFELISKEGDGCIEYHGIYGYTGSPSYFEVNGEDCDQGFYIARYKDGDIREEFELTFEADQDIYEGTWTKEDKQENIWIERVNYSTDIAGDFIKGCKIFCEEELPEDVKYYSIGSNVDLIGMKNSGLYYNSSSLPRGLEFANTRIYTWDDYENDAGGYTNNAVFSLVKSESERLFFAVSYTAMSWSDDEGDDQLEDRFCFCEYDRDYDSIIIHDEVEVNGIAEDGKFVGNNFIAYYNDLKSIYFCNPQTLKIEEK